MKRTNRRRQMFTLVAAYRKGNESRKEFCSRHKVSLSTFGWWQQQYRNAAGGKKGSAEKCAPGFLRIMAGPQQTASFELCFTDGTIMRFPASIEDERLVSILRHVRDGQRCSAL